MVLSSIHHPIDWDQPKSMGGPTPTTQSPYLAMFETFRNELDEHHDRRERIIKASRDITALSKKMQALSALSFYFISRLLTCSLTNRDSLCRIFSLQRYVIFLPFPSHFFLKKKPYSVFPFYSHLFFPTSQPTNKQYPKAQIPNPGKREERQRAPHAHHSRPV